MHYMTTAVRKLRVLWILAFLAAFLGMSDMAQAQPNLNFKRVTVNWPTIELYSYNFV